ncbi:MAG: Glu-tRNA(Gln) amidotransferase subunit GatD, partial [Candidatus Aenigmarchaeota archaeon]|nr:Glu-tRNA(Gln) amidotransferase subunit GatD [Candidatus Aenigmarchaeota archaeon]
IKLKNGYNIGIKFERGLKIEKVGKGEKIGKIPSISFRENSKLPNISIITTGGTIGTHVDYFTGGVYMCRRPEEIVATTPELLEIVNIKNVLAPFTIASEDMGKEEWIKLAKIVGKELNKKEIEGVIITHGTDTMHFTSAALSFMLQNLNKPVILTGAQRSPDRGSFDGRLNLICSAYSAISDIAEVGIVMHANANDDFCYFHRGTKVRKMHTSKRDAFRSINQTPLAKVWPNGRIEILNERYRKRDENRKVKVDAKFEEKVALIKVYPNSDPKILEWFIERGYKGIVIEGTGLGHVPTLPLRKKNSWIPYIRKAIKNDVVVVVTSQTIYGRTHPYVYRNLRILAKEGVVFGEDMLAEVAYVKLGWLLAHKYSVEKVKELMKKSLVGEISERSAES